MRGAQAGGRGTGLRGRGLPGWVGKAGVAWGGPGQVPRPEGGKATGGSPDRRDPGQRVGLEEGRGASGGLQGRGGSRASLTAPGGSHVVARLARTPAVRRCWDVGHESGLQDSPREGSGSPPPGLTKESPPILLLVSDSNS